jgi:hypothetical protein
MYIPLDRLYHFIDQTAREIYGEPVLIYRFWPHGSKNITDLHILYNCPWVEIMCSPLLWCNDQEPLDFDYYSKQSVASNKFKDLLKSLNIETRVKNLNYAEGIFGKNLLLHSEKRSLNIEKYIANDTLIPVYYWSHAVIARDWFRYAQYQNFKKNTCRLFLIYNRAWTGTREYRLKFTDLLIENGLIDQCQSFCNPVSEGNHYQDYKFANHVWKPKHTLENFFPPTLSESWASADFNSKDYSSTRIEVVLETLFDDDRLHLTEKSLRPIACGQPFILAATHGSLQYLQDYGFQTYESVWDESYDNISDPYQRMLAIIAVMRDISTWSDQKKNKNLERMDQIAKFNQNYFFSDKFQQLIISELKENLIGAFEKIRINPGFERWIGWCEKNVSHPQIQNFLVTNQDQNLPTIKDYQQTLDYIKNYSKKSSN